LAAFETTESELTMVSFLCVLALIDPLAVLAGGATWFDDECERGFSLQNSGVGASKLLAVWTKMAGSIRSVREEENTENEKGGGVPKRWL
jgi:hypothetical protein